jgi:hypothetical protein
VQPTKELIDELFRDKVVQARQMVDSAALSAIVIPAALIEQVIDGPMTTKFEAWLAAPASPFYVMHIAGSCPRRPRRRLSASIGLDSFNGASPRRRPQRGLIPQPTGAALGEPSTSRRSPQRW